MPIDPSMEPMLDTFIYETTTLLDQLDQILLDSEKSKSFSSDSVNEVFRIMHTIKGSAAMMDLGGISSLAHAVEDVFYILREDPTRLSLGGEALFDVVFQASDFLKSEVDSVQNTGDATQDPSAMIQELERLSAVCRAKRPSIRSNPRLRRHRQNRLPRYRRPSPACIGSGYTSRKAVRWKISGPSCSWNSSRICAIPWNRFRPIRKMMLRSARRLPRMAL